ncbi:MAG TPA: hypothetical protein VFE67_09330 [Rudaea sp.]|nr:hypothetical protein [Rudaea sp.]
MHKGGGQTEPSDGEKSPDCKIFADREQRWRQVHFFARIPPEPESDYTFLALRQKGVRLTFLPRVSPAKKGRSAPGAAQAAGARAGAGTHIRDRDAAGSAGVFGRRSTPTQMSFAISNAARCSALAASQRWKPASTLAVRVSP